MISSKKILLLFVCVAIQISAFSQCAMCRAALETDLKSGGSAGAGINNGIIYLMFFPYLLIAVVGFIIYRHYQKNKSIKKI